MSRYIQELKLDQPIDVVSMIVEDYVYHHRFQRNDWNGEMVYYMKDKHGKERYMKWNYTNGVFHLEAWLKNAFGGEDDLTGFGSSPSKNEFRQSLELLVRTLKTQKASTISSGHVGSDPLHHTSNHAAEHRAQRQGQQMPFGTMPGRSSNVNGNQGKASDVSLIISAVLALMFASVPVVGLIIAIRCLKRASDSKGSQQYNVARILCTIALFMSIMSLITGILPAMILPVIKMF